MSSFIDITNMRVGKLLVIRKSTKRNKHNDILWECACDCGGSKLATSGALRSGATKSCGCLIGNPTHGDWNKRIRVIWVNMMRRCYSLKDKQYKNYGGRGIRVCEKWKNYENFKKWAFENGYNDTLTIERRNVNKGYNPANCKWATTKEQNNNRRSNRFIEIGTENKTISQWSDLYGIGQTRIRRRLEKGWSALDAVSKPINTKKISNKYK